ncbi:hypothetical protein NOVOSPHI9U_310081 [Novosphingobium sp. 9U]|nr:hypothetical protein NOVOSPHI9U_310081 [Novosphingobium sp. 9U]
MCSHLVDSVTSADHRSPQGSAVIPSRARVWIAMGHTDMRRGMPGLALLVQQCLGARPHGGDLFVFRGRSGSLVKMIWHDGSACRSTPSAWSVGASCGLLPRMAS